MTRDEAREGQPEWTDREGGAAGPASPSWEEPPPGAVAVVGMAGRFPGAPDVEALWRLLCAGEEGISRFGEAEAAAEGVPAELLEDPSWVRAGGVLDDPARFDAELFGLSPREAELTDPQHRWLLETAWAALEDAGLRPGATPGRVGVYAGAGQPSYLLDHVHPAVRGRLDDLASAYAVTLGNDKDFLATRIAYRLDLRGPALTVGTACSTSLVAVCLAASALASGECDVALAGGATLRLPLRAGYPYQPDGILSPDGRCRPFDAAARGTVPGSGVGMVVLKRLEDARADGDPVRAVIRGWATNNDGGGKAGYTAPRVEGQEEVVREALALAGVDPATVGFVEGHGTATPLGDPIEVEALRRAFAAAGTTVPGRCRLGSLKGNLGHLDAAAGVAGLVKAVLAVERGHVPPTLHFTAPNPRLRLEESPFRVNAAGEDWGSGGDGRAAHPRRAGVSSFGIGGTNAHVVIEQAPPRPPRSPAVGPHLLVLSAATEEALAATARRLGGWLTAPPATSGATAADADLRDVAWTLHSGRRTLRHRRAVVVRDPSEALRVVAGPGGADAVPGPGAASGRSWTAALPADAGSPAVAFLFPGQGAQHPGMGAELYRRAPVFRRAVDRCVEILGPHFAGHPGLDLAWALPPSVPAAGERDEAARRLTHTALAQPAVFVLGWALAELWESWGVVPEAFLGHSIGEYVAACRAGVASLEDALEVVAARGLLMADLPRGSMLAVPLAEEELARRLDAVSPALAVAAVNAPGLCVASGPTAAVEELARRLEAEGVQTRPLHTSHAFHSPLVEAAVEPFRERVSRISLAPPRVPFLSNVTGTWITDGEATDPGYWARHLAATVRFAPAVEVLLAEPDRLLVEVGPGQALASLVRRHPAARGRTVVSSLPAAGKVPAGEGEGEGEARTLLAAAAQLFVAGLEPPRATLDGEPGRRISLPSYPFGGEGHWIPAQRWAAAGEAERTAAAGVEGRAGDPSAGPGDREPAAAGGVAREPDPADWFYLPSWKRLPPLPRFAGGTGSPAGAGSGGRGGSGEGPGGAGVLLVAGGPGGADLARRLAAVLEARGEAVEVADGSDSAIVARRAGEKIRQALARRAQARAEDGEATQEEGTMGAGSAAGEGTPPSSPSLRVVWLGAVQGATDPVDGKADRLDEKEAGGSRSGAAPESGSPKADAELSGSPGKGEGSGPGGGGAASLEAVADAASTALAFLELARALSEAATEADEEVHLVAVSDALHEVSGETARRPGRAAAAGLARVVPQEMPGLTCRWIDLPAVESSGDADLEALAAELPAPEPHRVDGRAAAGPDRGAASAAALPPPLVALRGGRRWGQTFERIRLEAPTAGSGGFRRGGRYLLVGGAGRFGLALAEHLLRDREARVLVLDREPPDEEVLERLRAEATADGTATHDDSPPGAPAVPSGDPTAARVEVLAGDAADPAVLRRALELAASRWGGLDGVVHAAGPPAGAYRPLAEVGAQDLALHLAARLAVAAALDRVLGAPPPPAADRPAFVLATSSLAPVLGGVGLGLHAAADATLDALGAQRAAHGAPVPWLSVGWEIWDQPFAGAVGHTLGAQQTALALSREELLDTAGRAVALAGHGWALVASGDLSARVEQWTRTARARRPRPAPADDGERQVPYRAPRDETEGKVVEIWEAVLGVPRIGIDDDFFLLGGDSLAGLQVLSRLRSELRVELPLESFFEARTVAGMGEVIAAERSRSEEEAQRMEAMLAEIESLSEDEVAALLDGEEGA